MASVMSGSPYAERRTGERRRVAPSMMARAGGLEGLRVSWGGVWGGVLVRMGALILLSALGVAIGITALDPSTADPNRLATIAAVWGGVSLPAALVPRGMGSTRIGTV